MPLIYNGKNIILAKNLRKKATPQEKHLWYDFLSTYKVRFQRQKAIDNFIADFYCCRAKLIIEIDGTQHRTASGKIKDELRTEILNERRREFAFQGHRWFDLRRTTQPSIEREYKGIVYTLEENDERYTLRLPVEAVAANPELEIWPY